MAAIGAQMHVGNHNDINVSFFHKLKFWRNGFSTALEKQFRFKKSGLPVFFLIEFYLKWAEEIKYADKQAYGEKWF